VEEQGAQKGRAALGLGPQPAYVVITGSKWASVPAGDILAVERGFTVGDITDAVVSHGDVPDRVVRADLTDLEAKCGAEVDRRQKLMDAAFKLGRGR
jgi:hypothetical protein